MTTGGTSGLHPPAILLTTTIQSVMARACFRHTPFLLQKGNYDTSTPTMDLRRKRNLQAAVMVAVAATLSCKVEGYSVKPSFIARTTRRTALMIYAPPESGYATPEDEQNLLPESYEPMMEFPGTMRPGRTPENQPFHDLPIGDNDPDPVPWPHFQQIEWHHRWEPPHPHPVPMEEFIELQGRWATPEMEAAMRAGARRDVRERRELAENDRKSTLIMDDDEDDIADEDIPVELGEGMYGQLGSAAEDAVTADAVSPSKKKLEVTMDDEEDDDFDDFLLDLGLDADPKDFTPSPKLPNAQGNNKSLMGAMESMLKQTAGDNDDNDIDLDLDLGLLDNASSLPGGITKSASSTGMSFDNDEFDESAAAAIDEDDGLDSGLEDDDELGGDEMTLVPLDDFADDNLDDEDSFDDSGFDYDAGDYGDGDSGGDTW